MFATIRFLALSAAMVLASAAASADVKLPALISDNMVLQQGRPINVWGWAGPAEKVTVTLGQQTADAVADAKGMWKVAMQALPASSEPIEMTVVGKNTLTVRNILVGEVWVCSGQSNMARQVQRAKDGPREKAAADFPMIRLFRVPVGPVADALEDIRPGRANPDRGIEGQWQVCSPQSVGLFSAVGYYFGRAIFQALNVPVGLISSCAGGTGIEFWTPIETYRTDPTVAYKLAAIEQNDKEFPAASEAYEPAYRKWQATTQAVLATNPAATRPVTQPGAARLLPRKPAKPQPSAVKYGGMYNGMVAPLTAYAIAGVIWYQGEYNAEARSRYDRQLPAMIRAWRKAWGYEFPFLIVQLPNFKAATDDPNVNSDWATLRESQASSLSVPKTGLAVAIDVGEADDIHPKDKQTVGMRLAISALAVAYGKDIVYSGPMFDSMTTDGEKLRVKFKHTGSGLMVKGDKLDGFAIAGADGKYFWAEAAIDGDSVVLTSPQVPHPVAIRYAWADNPKCNLYNRESLPAVPFRAGEKLPTTQPATAPAE